MTKIWRDVYIQVSTTLIVAGVVGFAIIKFIWFLLANITPR